MTKDEGIPLMSPEGLTFVAIGLGFLAFIIMANKSLPTQGRGGPSGTIGVRG